MNQDVLRMKLCWAPIDTEFGQRRYYTEAAEITFYTPPQGMMKVYPITKASDTIGPIAIGWAPRAGAKFGSQFPQSAATVLTW